MDQFVEGKNPYTILGLENGQQSTVDEIKKVQSAIRGDTASHATSNSNTSAVTVRTPDVDLPFAGLSPFGPGKASRQSKDAECR